MTNEPAPKGVVHFIAIDLTGLWLWEGLAGLERFLAESDGDHNDRREGSENDRPLRSQ